LNRSNSDFAIFIKWNNAFNFEKEKYTEEYKVFSLELETYFGINDA